MNRQEAIDRLKNEVKRIEEIMGNGDCGCVDMDTWNEFAKKAEWRETLIELLSGPVPDPNTGLVPCGCGGKAETHELFGHYSGTYMTDCKECATGTTQYNTEKESQDAWNTAMGWKGGAE